MARSTRSERQEAVISAAITRIHESRLDWASTLTYQELSLASGIDQAQIARDFGSKDGLVRRIAERLLAVDTTTQPQLDNDAVALDFGGVNDLAEWVVRFGATNDRLSRSEAELDLLRNQIALWTSADADSVEQDLWSQVYERYADASEAEVEEAFSILVDSGQAVRRSAMTVRELVVAIGALIEGLQLRAIAAPGLISDDLTAKAIGALITAALGPDATTPEDQLRQIKLGASNAAVPRENSEA